MTVDRRSFLTGVARTAAFGLALPALGGCDALFEDEAPPADDLAMHGPVRTDPAVLKLPAAPDAAALLGPYAEGAPFERRWAVGHVARGHQDQIYLSVVDLDTGGHAEVQIFAAGDGPRPVAATRRYALYLDNGGIGRTQTPPHLRRVVERLAELVARNEDRVQPGWVVPSFRPSFGPEDTALRGPLGG